MAGDNEANSKAERITLAEEIGTLSEIRLLLEIESYDVTQETRDGYITTIDAIIERNTKTLAGN
jgi:hypothetical protein